MTRVLLKPVPEAVISAQRQAADPTSSVWVSANAGSGKTHVLTQRVLRLLLGDVQPDEVLCLTYTKAAAAEMRKRIAGRLAQWALLDETRLKAELADITGNIPTADECRRARTLFAHALDTPGGLRIQTIHAFCESVLHRFPVEAGVPFDFTVLEDHQRQAMILRARETVLAGGLGGGSEAGAVETLFGAMSDFLITDAIDEAFGKARALRPILADAHGAKARLRRQVGLAPGAPTVAQLREEIETGTLLKPADCRELVQLLGGDPRKSGARFANKLAGVNLDRLNCDDLLTAFLTEQGAKRANNLLSKPERLRFPELSDRFEAENDRIAALAAELKRTDLVERSEALLDILGAIVARYEADKRARSLLDFDDLIERAGTLFGDPNLGLWVRYKLDAQITHILVDESQDTNKEQWDVVRQLAGEFFEGESAVRKPRTIFAVGDGKQSIYSFQGANPRLFAEAGREFAERAGYVDMRFARVPLTTSFRTLPNVLDAVDRVFADADRAIAVLAEAPVQHRTARAEGGGMVTLWPPIQSTGDVADLKDDWPLEAPDMMQKAPRRVAQRIAREIRTWVETGRPLGPRGRPVRPEDVLILVQTRAALFHEIIRALLSEGLPTPGADRLYVTTHIAILDLMALGDVLLNPADDLQLAALLRSPLFDVSEDDLFALANGRAKGQNLWSALRDSPLTSARAAAAALRGWRGRLDLDRPYEFYAQILYAEGGLKRFHGRFGPEVDDLFAEFLDLALEHETSANPSLQGFLAEMRSREEVTITRELGTSTRGVRVMTVHGAKGLEAPIVILADATTKPEGRQLARGTIIDAERGILFHSKRSTDVRGTAEIRAEEEAASWREFWRKLYVGMTRAEDELYVTGAFTPSRSIESQLKGSWYEAIESSLKAASEVVTDADGSETAIIFPAQRPPPKPVGATPQEGLAALAGVSLAPLAPHAVIPVIRPSSAYEAKADEIRALATAAETAVDPETARTEGIALHALLQHLSRIEEAARPAIALRALRTLLPDAPDSHERLAAKAVSILSRPELAHLFGPESRAEVPFLANAARAGKPVRLAGRIDRLVVTPDHVLVVDFKSDADPVLQPDRVPAKYLAQLGLYALVAGQLFPSHEVRAGILWTSLESLLELSREALAEAASTFTMR